MSVRKENFLRKLSPDQVRLLTNMSQKLISRPNPASYNPRYDIVKEKSPSVKFSKSPKRLLTHTSHTHIGPSSYKPKQEFVKYLSPRVKFPKSKIQNYNNNVPGPGSYNVQSKQKNNFPRFGTVYQKQQPDHSPGPGQYNSHKDKKNNPIYLARSSREFLPIPETKVGP